MLGIVVYLYLWLVHRFDSIASACAEIPVVLLELMQPPSVSSALLFMSCCLQAMTIARDLLIGMGDP